MNLDVKITGLASILGQLDDLVNMDSLEQGMKASCALVERSAKQNVPVATGELRRSISSKVETDGQTVTGTIYTPLEYAPYIEYGTGLFAEKGGRNTPWSYQDDKGEWHTTSGMPPQPFMRPALERNRTAILEKLGGSINND